MAGKSSSSINKKRPEPPRPDEPASDSVPAAKKRKWHAEKPARATRRDEKRDIMSRAKALWEQLRPKATSKSRCQDLVTQLEKLLQGRLVEFVFRHDGSRIVQWMLAEGNEGQKKRTMNELMKGWGDGKTQQFGSFFVRLSGDRYGKHLACKMLRVGGRSIREQIFEKELRGNVMAIMRNGYGGEVLDLAFQVVLRAKERTEMVGELLYGRERKLWDTVRPKLVRENGEPNGKSLFEWSLDLVGNEFKNVVVESAANVLGQLIEKESLLRSELVHMALKEYMEVVMKRYGKDKSVELALLLGPMLVHLGHTKPGAWVAVTCVKILDAKHRKKVVRGLKGHFRNLNENEFGHLILLALLEWVDDTRLVGKTLTTELLEGAKLDLEVTDANDERPKKRAGKKSKQNKAKEEVDVDYVLEMCRHKYGRMGVLSLLWGRSTRYFHPQTYSSVWEDIDVDKFGQVSKKDPEVRRSELRQGIVKAMQNLVENSLSDLIKCQWSAPVALGVVVQEETKEAAMDAVAELIGDSEQLESVLKSVCGRKTLGTMFKLGEKDMGSFVLSKCGSEGVERLMNVQNGEKIAESLANLSQSADAIKLVEKLSEERGEDS